MLLVDSSLGSLTLAGYWVKFELDFPLLPPKCGNAAILRKMPKFCVISYT